MLRIVLVVVLIGVVLIGVGVRQMLQIGGDPLPRFQSVSVETGLMR